MAYSNQEQRMNASAGLASVGTAGLLVAIKAWALWQTGALSVGASLADSAVDLVISAAGLVAILYAAKPADDDHAFGHSSAEDLAALGQALIVLGSAAAIGIAAVRRLLSPTPPELAAQGAGIAVMIASALITAALVWWQGRVARSTGNKVVAADRLHYVGDLLPTLGAILALWLSHDFGWSDVDSIVALIAAAIMLSGAGRIGVGAWNALMDRAAPDDVIEGIAAIARDWPGVRGFHDLKTRTAGAQIFVNLHIELDGDQTLEEAHDIGAALKRAIVEAYPQADVIIHKDVYRS
ncbi:MAG: cation diffusion facilitator family transporter [Rhodobacteraceae bacterium]|uniref:Cation-efflux pump n=1 Tax=Thioclava marina TaxID=1915077 RepID=A0ABX3MP45_9RHOB|nr:MULTISPECIES: cation diffusion facilitator family transporter [Thioclava]OOY13304.1 cation-efflux pump [Thioclava marina]OOY29014.1 cation-efflux pump [Thioclava sp. L04-15]TNE83742.1 MAG: cation diffusion facilitator family transporter [Paracoccaceae bacterium]TNF14434.1 MAG: cation diffusion facilitator family transporter [Paracoccaceae bacterium]